MAQDEKNSKSNIEDIYELTPMQQGMLYHTLYTEGSDVYIEQFIYSLAGDLDKVLFKKAWEKVISRHGALRTSFQWKGISKPVQLVNREVEMIWSDTDWSQPDSNQQEIEFNNFIKADREKVFSLEKPPLMRFNLIDLGNHTYKFIWTFHHILMDGWSYPVIQKEVFEIYRDLKENKDTELPRPASFKEYIHQVVLNCKTLADELLKRGYNLVSGGTDNHLMLINLVNKKMTGKEAENLLHSVNITVNKNAVPNDPESPFVTSGIRVGTAACTTKGLKEDDMKKLAEAMDLVLSKNILELDEKSFEENMEKAKEIVKKLTEKYV